MKSICVFCASSVGNNPLYAQVTQQVGEALANRQITLVYGGGAVGLMGILADSVLKHQGKVIGVIPETLFAKEVAHTSLTQIHFVSTMHERKKMMYSLSDAFIALPGGIGTLEELCEILTWAQLGLHHKPCGILNVNGYFDPLLEQLERAVRDGFLAPKHKQFLIADVSIEPLIEKLIT